ncbi:MAG: carboxypeptidase-like regulatory domain-containing protein [Pyrinomonadaceae bacterium]|nr:carboxypeptidase-like regulatory domain-containing protein [Pyrinomonadaceae bacterium]
MRILQILVLLFLVNSFVNAQVCGYTFLTIYLTDSKGNPIKNAEIKTFEKQAYFGSEGMCSGHQDVGFRITAKGFEKFDFVTNLNLGWTSYEIKLKRDLSKEIAKAVKLAHFRGEIFDQTKAVIPFADIEIIDENGKIFSIKTNDNGRFQVDLPQKKFTIKIKKQGFRRLKIINFNLEDTKTIWLDLTLKVRGCDDCDDDMFGGNDGENNRKEEVLDYQSIKKNND